MKGQFCQPIHVKEERNGPPSVDQVLSVANLDTSMFHHPEGELLLT